MENGELEMELLEACTGTLASINNANLSNVSMHFRRYDDYSLLILVILQHGYVLHDGCPPFLFNTRHRMTSTVCSYLLVYFIAWTTSIIHNEFTCDLSDWSLA